MNILFFGIGVSAEILEKRLRKEHTIIGYTDSRAEITTYKGKKFFPVTQIEGIDYDYIIITSENRSTAWTIFNMLCYDYNIPSGKILPYYIFAEHEWYSIELGCGKKNIEGLIFGNSHARDGFLCKYLPFEAINLSTTSQDIYGYYRIFQECITKYRDRLKELRYVVIDMYDYNMFNYDVSLSTELFNYIDSNGLMEEHNFADNSNYSGNFDDNLFSKLKLIRGDCKHKELLEELFYLNIGSVKDLLLNIYSNRNVITENAPLTEEKIIGSLVLKKYDKTISENIELFHKLMSLIYEYNSQMKVFITLIPRYVTMEMACEPFMKQWKKDFYDIINSICVRYGCIFIDFKSSGISRNNYFYRDVNHLNTAGGICLTSELNQYLFRQE